MKSFYKVDWCRIFIELIAAVNIWQQIDLCQIIVEKTIIQFSPNYFIA